MDSVAINSASTALLLTGFLPASQLQIEFDAEMNATNDYWYLDDLRLTGTQ